MEVAEIAPLTNGTWRSDSVPGEGWASVSVSWQRAPAVLFLQGRLHEAARPRQLARSVHLDSVALARRYLCSY